MLVYLLKSVACLAILFAFYKIFLEKENMHVFKRFYLLGSLAFSLLVPALVFTEYVEVAPVVTPVLETTYTAAPQTTNSEEFITLPPALETDVLDIAPLLWIVYFIGLFFFGLKFIRNLFQIFRRIRRNPKHKLSRFTQVLLQETIPPHTFFSYIFLNKTRLESNEIPKEVLLHEETHARQKHSYDVVLVEFLQVILWINPLVYFFKKAIKLNHEFLADQAVLKKNIDKATYQNTLLSYLSSDSKKKYQPLANAINYSSIKKRFTVMKTHTSKRAILIRSILMLPLLAALILGFSQKEILEKYSETKHSILGDWIDEEQELVELSIIKDSENFIFRWKDSPIMKVQEKDGEFFLISSGEMRKLNVHFNSKTNIITFNKQKFIPLKISFKGKLYGQWINKDENLKFNIFHSGNEMVWEVIKGHKKPVRYYPKKQDEGYAFTHNNELWTFKVENGKLYDSKGKVYSRITKSSEQIKTRKEQPEEIRIDINKNNQILFKESLIAKEFLLTSLERYNTKLSWEEKNSKVHAVIYHDSKTSSKMIKDVERILESYGVSKINILEIGNSTIKSQDGASKKQIAEYNALAKKYNRALSKSKSIQIKLKDVERLEYIYGLMSDKQKAAAEPFPDFPEPPPPPKAPKEPKESNNEEVKLLEQEVLMVKHEAKLVEQEALMIEQEAKMIAQEALMIKNEVKMIEQEALMIKNEVKMIEQEALKLEKNEEEMESYIQNQIASQEIIAEENVRVYQYGMNFSSMDGNPGLTNTLKVLANQEAQFYFNGSKVSTEKGMQIVKNKKNITIETHPYTNRKPEVKIYTYKNDISIPPPPMPPKPVEPIDHVIAMAKKNAKFYFEGKAISSDKAIELIKNNDEINIDSRTSNGKQPVVKLSTEPINH